MDELHSRLLAVLNTARKVPGLRPVELDVDYGAVCQREADAAIEIRGMPTGSGGTSLDAMNAAGLLHATSVVTVSCLIDVPPAPEDADAGGDAYRVAVERSVADTAVALLKSATEPAGTPDEALRSRLLSPALTDVAFGVSAHTDGRLRMVVALVARPVLAVSLSGGAAEAGVLHVRASDVVSGGGDDEEGGGGTGGAGGGLGTFSVGVRSLAPEWAVLGAHLTVDAGPQASIIVPAPPFACPAVSGAPATAYLAVYKDGDAADPARQAIGAVCASIWPWQLARAAAEVHAPTPPPKARASAAAMGGEAKEGDAAEGGAAGGGKEAGDDDGITAVADDPGGGDSDSDDSDGGGGSGEVRIGGASRATRGGGGGADAAAAAAAGTPIFSIAVPILAAATKARAAAAAAGAPPPPGRFILHVLRRAWDPVAHPDWPAIPYGAPQPGYDAEMTVSAEAPAVEVGLRIVVVFEDDSAEGTASSAAKAAALAGGSAAGPPPVMKPQPFSEVAAFCAGALAAGGGATAVATSAAHHPPVGFHEQAMPMAAGPRGGLVLPLRLSVADSASRGRVTHVLLLSAASEAAAALDCPQDYDVVPGPNLASLVEEALGDSLPPHPPLSPGAPDSAAALPAFARPAWVAIAVRRSKPENEGGGDGATAGGKGGEERRRSSGARFAPPLVDVALAVVAGAAQDPPPRGSPASVPALPLAFPTCALPDGYTSQMVDLILKVPVPPSAAEEEEEAAAAAAAAAGDAAPSTLQALLGGGSTGDATASSSDLLLLPPAVPEPRVSRIPVRILLLSTADPAAAQRVYASGGGVTVGPEPLDSEDDDVGAALAASSSSASGLRRSASSSSSRLGGGGGGGASHLSSSSLTGRGDVAAQERAQLIELITAALEEQEALAAHNAAVQARLAQYFLVRQSDEERDRAAAGAAAAAATPALAAAAADKERRYRETLGAIATERDRSEEARARAEDTATDLSERLGEKEGRAADAHAAFAELKHVTATGAVHSHTGMRIAAPVLERYEAAEAAKERQVGDVLLTHVQLAGQVAKLEAALAKREQLAEGLAMIDFEQLKIENSALNEKVEDRNEELGRLRKKTVTAVQVLTHVREKAHFVTGDVGRLSAELEAIEAEVAASRAALSTTRQHREALRSTNEKAQAQQGFAHVDALAIDFEKRKRAVVAQRSELARLRRRHEELMRGLQAQGRGAAAGAYSGEGAAESARAYHVEGGSGLLSAGDYGAAGQEEEEEGGGGGGADFGYGDADARGVSAGAYSAGGGGGGGRTSQQQQQQRSSAAGLFDDVGAAGGDDAPHYGSSAASRRRSGASSAAGAGDRA